MSYHKIETVLTVFAVIGNINYLFLDLNINLLKMNISKNKFATIVSLRRNAPYI